MMKEMNDAKAKLLGLGRLVPSPGLKETAARTEEQYRELLDESLGDPGAFWKKRYAELEWVAPPGESVGGTDGPGLEGSRISPFLNCVPQDLAGDSILISGTDPAGARVDITAGRLRSLARSLHEEIAREGVGEGAKALLVAPPDHRMLEGVLACLACGLQVLPVTTLMDSSRIGLMAQRAGCAVQVVVDGTDVPAVAKQVVCRTSTEDTVDEKWGVYHGDSPAISFPDAGDHLFDIPAAGFLVRAKAAFQENMGGGRPGKLWLANRYRTVSFIAAAAGSLMAKVPVGTICADAKEDRSTFMEHLERAEAGALLMDTDLMYRLLAKEGDAACETLRLVMVEGESVSPEQCKRLVSEVFKGAHMVQILARSETGGLVAAPDPLVSSIRPASVHKACPGVPLTVVDHKGEICPAGMGGLLALSSRIPGLATSLKEADLPLALEVKARMNAASEIWTMGEIQIERKQESAAPPLELESFVAALQGVEQVAVVKFKDQDGKDRLRVFVQIEDPEDDKVLDRIRAAAADRFGDVFGPDGFKAAKSLPRSRSGKLLRSVLRRVSAGEPLAEEDMDLIADPGAVEELK